MNDPHNTQAYANAPYAREAWLDLVQRVDRDAVDHVYVFFEDDYTREFCFKKVGTRIALQDLDSFGVSTVLEISVHRFQKLLHELNSFLKGG